MAPSLIQSTLSSVKLLSQWNIRLQERLRAALDRANIKQWELFQVDNACCDDAPLDLPGADASPGQSLRELATSGALAARL